MLKYEIIDNRLIKTSSDKGNYIIQNETGIKYEEAIDLPGRYTYTETDEKIEEE